MSPRAMHIWDAGVNAGGSAGVSAGVCAGVSTGVSTGVTAGIRLGSSLRPYGPSTGIAPLASICHSRQWPHRHIGTTASDRIDIAAALF